MILGTRWLASVWGEGHIPMAMQSFLLLMNFTLHNTGIVKASSSRISPSNDDDGILSDIFDDGEVETNNRGTSFLSKLAIALGIAATITLLSVCFKGPNFGSSLRFPFSFDGSSPLISSGSPVGYTLSIFGCQVVLPEYTPGWIYFWLLMAAGCGIFISEEALNVWVGISLARSLSLDGTWNTFMISFSKNAPTLFLQFCGGVCISDMIPFYLGRLFRQTKASVDICSKLGIGKDKVVSITRVVQKYGNMIGFVERFSVGARNPTSFLAVHGLLGIGFLLRERPAMALAGVATVVGMWTLLPYAIAASAALFMFLRQRLSS
ncbi:unnamed protein product [Spirodela intermedia]|uniref:Uncharacterized protein n=1 Tax=Spirodela intermedia TaxID=51605 RepID=A0A7I8INK0_SPIIN|nr:unnamed protein product [Spirodela intermedia]CAA6659547.1 unnamed protein product [Spirodela intermedia]